MRVLDLFCGAGGMALGMAGAGLRIVASYDYDEKALAVHKANIKHGTMLRPVGTRRHRRHVEADLRDLLTMAPDIAELAPDVIVGGPPCQPFSRAGKGLGDVDPRAKLTEAFGVIVATARPRYVVMENVPDIRRSNVYRRTTLMLRRAGYGLTETTLDASFYGTGQRRRRWLCIGCLGEADDFLLDYLAEAKSKHPTTVADVLGSRVGKVFFRRGHDGGDRRSFWPADGPSPTITSTQNRLRAGSTDGNGYVLREADVRFLEEIGVERLYWLTPGGSSSAGTRSVDEPAPTFTHTSVHKQYPSYKPRPGDVLDVHSLPVLPFEDLSLLGGFPLVGTGRRLRPPAAQQAWRQTAGATSFARRQNADARERRPAAPRPGDRQMSRGPRARRHSERGTENTGAIQAMAREVEGLGRCRTLASVDGPACGKTLRRIARIPGRRPCGRTP